MFGNLFKGNKGDIISSKLAAALLAPGALHDKLTIDVHDVHSRKDADTYVCDHSTELNELFDEAFATYNHTMSDLFTLKDSYGDFDLHLTGNVPCHLSTYAELLDSTKVGLLCINGSDAKFYYTRAEICGIKDDALKRSGSYSKVSELKPSYFEDLEHRLSVAYYERFLPSDGILAACNNKSQVTPELVLKGICLGDYIGQPYEALVSRTYYDPGKPFDVHENAFTDDTFMSVAMYDAFKSIKNTASDTTTRAYEIIVRSMRYYVNMFPNVGYGPRFYAWAVNNTDNYESYANGGAMRAGIIGAFFDDIEDVIRYAIISSYPTHSHPVGEMGAVLTAVCVWLAAHGASKADIKTYAEEQCHDIFEMPHDVDLKVGQVFNMNYKPDDMTKYYNEQTSTLFGTATVSEAIINFLNSDDYMGCVSNAMTYKCDADTVAAISGGIAAAYYRNIPYIDDIIKSWSDEKIPYEARFVMNRLSML